jgi:hypothetical protein
LSYFDNNYETIIEQNQTTSVGDRDPDPEDPHVFGLPDPDPLVRGMEPDPSLFSHKGVERTEIMLGKQNFNTKF